MNIKTLIERIDSIEHTQKTTLAESVEQGMAEDAGTDFGRDKHNLREGITQSLLDLFRSKEDILIRKAVEEIMNYHQTYRVMALKKAVELLKQEIAQGKSTQDSTDIVQTINRGMDDLELKEGLSKKVEGKKPDYLDFDKDGNKKEPMKQALKDKKHSKPDSLKESWTDFEDAKKAHEKAGGEVTGRPDDYTVTLADGTRRRYITKDGKRRVESLPSVKARNDDDEGTTVKASKKKKESEKTAAAPSAKQRGRPSGSKNKKKISEMTDFEFSALMGKFMLIEAEMTTAQKNKKKEIVTSMEKDSKALAGFKKRHGSRWKSVMNATATAQAMGKKPKTDNKD
jgi:hypothetical protein